MAEKKLRPVLTDTTPQITVLKNIVGCLDIGIGWNDSSCLDARWPEIRAAGFGGYARPFRRRFSEQDWDRYFGLMEWSGCHWLRHSISVSDWKTSGENRSGHKNYQTAYVFDSEKMQQHYLVLDQAEKRGIKVLLANWNLGAERPTDSMNAGNRKIGQWLPSSYRLSKRRKGKVSGSENRHPKNEDAFAEAMAALLYHLKREKKYECVWALSLWNEPDDKGGYTGPGANYPDSFWPLYKAVDRHLRRLGIGDEILLLGPDTTTGGRPQHILRMLEAHGPILDIIADHDYAAFRGKLMSRSVVSYKWLMQNLQNIYTKRVPFVISEFGNYGRASGPVNDDKQVYNGALSTTAYLIQMINNGVAGLARWEFSIYGNDWRNFGALTNTDEAYLFRPYAPVYYPHAVTARYIKPGWDVREVQIENGSDALFVTALTSNQGDLTLIILNDEINSISSYLTLDIQSSIGQLHRLVVRDPVSEGIIRCGDVPLGKQGIKIALPPKSITVLTSLLPGNLAHPAALALKRTSRDEIYHLLNRQLHFMRKQAGNFMRYFGGA